MTYHDSTREPRENEMGRQPHINWREFTNARLTFLYGQDHGVTRRGITDPDLRGWRRLGRGRAA